MKSITSAEYEESVKDGVSVVKYYAEWCAPCKMMKSVFTKVKESVDTETNFFEYDIESDPEFTRKMGITSVPVTHIVKNGEVKEVIVGAVPATMIKAKLEEVN